MATIYKDSVWKLVRGIRHTKLTADAKVISAFNHIMISKWTETKDIFEQMLYNTSGSILYWIAPIYYIENL